MLSYLEYYDCDYFLLENVKGLLDYPLMSSLAKGGRALEGGIKSGVVKLIMRALIALGYVLYFKRNTTNICP
jgi:DNA (cytosine-5)-methyltransferase 1